MAKSFVMQLAALATLFVSLPAFITLIFSIINLQFPDAADNYWQVESAESAIRYTIAILVIFFPAYLVLTRKVNQSRRTEGELYHTLTKWLIYLALLVAGMVILGDLAVAVYTFLSGEITIRFILKSVALLAVIGAASYYYTLDAQNYWQNKEKKSVQIGFAVLGVVLAFVVFGFFNIDTPSMAREVRIDQEQIYDLQDIQWRIEAFYQETNSFPASIEMLYQDVPVPVASEGREAYSFRTTGPDTYVLCATFTYATPASDRSMAKPIGIGQDVYLQNQNWEHSAGEKCFERKIIPLQ
ncbi:hypothetical protein H6789_01215 [Candidatus Nomurabacteria bacterium]|nr:hypothetical protein [Candidatus Nomurabacteria bacterium]